MGDGGERVLMGDGVSTTRLDGWWEGAGASWWVMGIALGGACNTRTEVFFPAVTSDCASVHTYLQP